MSRISIQHGTFSEFKLQLILIFFYQKPNFVCLYLRYAWHFVDLYFLLQSLQVLQFLTFTDADANANIKSDIPADADAYI